MGAFMRWLFSFLHTHFAFLRWVRPRGPDNVRCLRLRIPFMIWRTYCEPACYIKITQTIGMRMWCFKWLCLYLFDDPRGVIFRWEVKTLSIRSPVYAASRSTADPKRRRFVAGHDLWPHMTRRDDIR